MPVPVAVRVAEMLEGDDVVTRREGAGAMRMGCEEDEAKGVGKGVDVAVRTRNAVGAAAPTSTGATVDDGLDDVVLTALMSIRDNELGEVDADALTEGLSPTLIATAAADVDADADALTEGLTLTLTLAAAADADADAEALVETDAGVDALGETDAVLLGDSEADADAEGLVEGVVLSVMDAEKDVDGVAVTVVLGVGVELMLVDGVKLMLADVLTDAVGDADGRTQHANCDENEPCDAPTHLFAAKGCATRKSAHATEA